MKDFWYIDPELAEPEPITRVSAERLQRLLRIVGSVAAELEAQSIDHVGSFELFMLWQKFVEGRINPKTAVIKRYLVLYNEGGHSKLLSTYYHHITGRPVGRPYCASLLKHYNSAQTVVRTPHR
jgi:hypothetical protein